MDNKLHTRSFGSWDKDGYEMYPARWLAHCLFLTGFSSLFLLVAPYWRSTHPCTSLPCTSTSIPVPHHGTLLRFLVCVIASSEFVSLREAFYGMACSSISACRGFLSASSFAVAYQDNSMVDALVLASSPQHSIGLFHFSSYGHLPTHTRRDRGRQIELFFSQCSLDLVRALGLELG